MLFLTECSTILNIPIFDKNTDKTSPQTNHWVITCRTDPCIWPFYLNITCLLCEILRTIASDRIPGQVGRGKGRVDPQHTIAMASPPVMSSALTTFRLSAVPITLSLQVQTRHRVKVGLQRFHQAPAFTVIKVRIVEEQTPENALFES